MKSSTPTGDYNPTTKKYVDEALASSSAGVSIIVRSSQPTGQKLAIFGIKQRKERLNGLNHTYIIFC